jgi:hypothetical protein
MKVKAEQFTGRQMRAMTVKAASAESAGPRRGRENQQKEEV